MKKHFIDALITIALAGLLMSTISNNTGSLFGLPPITLEHLAFILIIAYAVHHLLHAIHIVYVKLRVKKDQTRYDFCGYAFTLAAGAGPLIYYTTPKIEAVGYLV